MLFNRRKNSQPINKDFEQFLKAYNCTHTIKQDEDETVYTFQFQGGNFIANIRHKSDYVEITFPSIASAPIDKLSLVRSKCNEHNSHNSLFKFAYSYDEEENELNVHISFFNNRVQPSEMANELSAAFSIRRLWYESFAEATKSLDDNDNTDLENGAMRQRREFHLLRQMEMRVQDSATGSMAHGTKALALWQMLDTVNPLPTATPLFMTVNTVDGQQRIEDEEQVRAYDLRRVLVEGEGKDARLVRDYAVIDLHYTQGPDKRPRLLTIAITAEGEDQYHIYSRATITQVPRNMDRDNSLSNEAHHTPASVSLLIALDRSSDKQHEQEFDYMWTEAKQKLKDGNIAGMSEEEKLLAQATNADVAYNLYWGQQMFYNERYYEALLHFENLIESYRKDFFELEGEEKRTFMETAYMLGFCYNELGLPKQAFYYLDLLANDGNIRHTMELVNSMANSKDLRLFSYTEGIMEEVKRNFSDEEELPEHIRDFINFLRRRRGYAFINFNQLDQAEKIFTQMLNEEENADYAINELAYIKRLRQERGDEKDTATTAHDNEAPHSDAPDAPPF